VSHSDKWKEYEDNAFTEEQLEALKAEPMLQVESGGGETVLPSYEDITEAQIVDRLDDMKVDRAGAKNKKDHYALLEQALKAKG
jgi:hypothetical protein